MGLILFLVKYNHDVISKEVKNVDKKSKIMKSLKRYLRCWV